MSLGLGGGGGTSCFVYTVVVRQLTTHPRENAAIVSRRGKSFALSGPINIRTSQLVSPVDKHVLTIRSVQIRVRQACTYRITPSDSFSQLFTDRTAIIDSFGEPHNCDH